MSRPLGHLTLLRSFAFGAMALGILFGLSCSSGLRVGQWGTFRYIGQVKGTPPLNMLPPISDRSGNIYTLYGAIGLPEVAAFVSRVTGGSYQACTLTRGDVYGAHGWVGFAQDRAWYWSGEALVQVPSSGACSLVLEFDPSTNVQLDFHAVVPWVKVTPSRTTLVALLQSNADPVPYSALIDLDVGIATNVAQFQPNDAADVTILGVGADPGTAVGFVLLTYARNGTTFMEARYFDESAALVATAPIRGLPPPEFGVVGYLQKGTTGKVVGLLSTGSLVAFDSVGGELVSIDPSITPVGVHLWGGQLWLVGTSAGKPVVAAIDINGHPQPATEWTASEAAGGGLRGALTVNDDRSYPARTTTWSTVTTAMGPLPFLTPHSPWPHASATTLWAAAGPSFQASSATLTAIAIAPVGISYP